MQFFAAVPPAAWMFRPDSSGKSAAGQLVTYFGGPVGIRPEAYREVRLALGVTAAQWRDIYPDVRVLEEAALEAMRASKP